MQGLLELLWTVYSEEKLQPCLKLRNFENPFSKNKSVSLENTMPQKGFIEDGSRAVIPQFATMLLFLQSGHFCIMK